MKSRFAFLFALLCVFAGTAAAQVMTGTLTGTVYDPSDAVIPGATVTVTDLGTSREHRAVTDSIGAFVLTNLDIGFYRVSVQAPSFGKGTVERVQINLGQMAIVRVKLPLQLRRSRWW